MAHHGKEGVVKCGSAVLGAVTGFTVDTTGDVVEDTSLGNAAKTYLAGRIGVTLDGVSTRTVAFQGTGALTIGTVS